MDDKQGSFHGDCGNNMVIHLAQLGWISLAKLNLFAKMMIEGDFEGDSMGFN